MEHFHLNEMMFGTQNWFHAEDLFRWVVRRSPEGARFVELGTFLGRSAAFLGVEIARAGKGQHLTTIDRFSRPEMEPVCRGNLASLAGAVTVLRSDSVAAARDFPDRSLELVYIDAGHRYEAVRADIAAWWPKVKPGGILAGDDLWWRAGDTPKPAMGGGPDYPVWRAVGEAFAGKYEVMVRRDWGIWWKQV